MARRGTNLPAVSQFNQAVVLDMIRRAPEGISRSEIARQAGLSGQTASNAARKLIDDGLVVETGTRISGRGKPSVLLQLVGSSRYAIGVHLDPAFVTYVLMDLAGTTVLKHRSRTPSVADPSTVVAEIAGSVRHLIDESSVDPDAIVGIGLAVPGPIDIDRGIIVDPPLLDGWSNVPLREELAARTGLPVLMAKDVNAAVIAENWDAGSESGRDFLFCYYGSGVGMGISYRGDALVGVTGNAGNGGGLVVPAAGLPAKRRSDMLGHVAGASYLVEQAREAGVLDPETDADRIVAFGELMRRASEGDADAWMLVERASRNIAAALMGAVNLLDVNDIIFGGPYWTLLEPLAVPVIRRELASSPYLLTHSEVRILPSRLGEEVVAIGAAVLTLDALYTPRSTSLLI